jgi:phosphate-selective porin
MTRQILCTTLLVVLLSPLAFAQQPTTPSPQTTVDISRGGVTIASGVNSLTIGARPQFRWTVGDREAYDADTIGTGVGQPDGAFSQFDVVRLRLSLSGGMYRPWFRYLFQFDFSRTTGESASKIKDAILEIRPVGKTYRFQVGQFKAPFGLQQLNSSGRLQFVDRAITDAKFNPGREMGVMFAGTIPGWHLGYEAGAFNGSGESVRQNNQSQLWVSRVYFDPFGTYTLAEGSSDAGDKPVLHIGGALRAGKAIRGRTPAGVIENADNELAYNVEFAYKSARFYSTAEHFWMIDEQANPVVGPDIDSRGYHAQASVMVVPKTTEVGVQYAWIAGNTNVDDSAVTEFRGVVSYYFQAHNLKLQADAGQVGFGPAFSTLSARARQGLPVLGPRLVSGEQLSDTQVRVQLTLIF